MSTIFNLSPLLSPHTRFGSIFEIRCACVDADRVYFGTSLGGILCYRFAERNIAERDELKSTEAIDEIFLIPKRNLIAFLSGGKLTLLEKSSLVAIDIPFFPVIGGISKICFVDQQERMLVWMYREKQLWCYLVAEGGGGRLECFQGAVIDIGKNIESLSFAPIKSLLLVAHNKNIVVISSSINSDGKLTLSQRDYEKCTKKRCKEKPLVTALPWGEALISHHQRGIIVDEKMQSLQSDFIWRRTPLAIMVQFPRIIVRVEGGFDIYNIADGNEAENLTCGNAVLCADNGHQLYVLTCHSAEFVWRALDVFSLPSSSPDTRQTIQCDVATESSVVSAVPQGLEIEIEKCENCGVAPATWYTASDHPLAKMLNSNIAIIITEFTTDGDVSPEEINRLACALSDTLRRFKSLQLFLWDFDGNRNGGGAVLRDIAEDVSSDAVIGETSVEMPLFANGDQTGSILDSGDAPRRKIECLQDQLERRVFLKVKSLLRHSLLGVRAEETEADSEIIFKALTSLKHSSPLDFGLEDEEICDVLTEASRRVFSPRKSKKSTGKNMDRRKCRCRNPDEKSDEDKLALFLRRVSSRRSVVPPKSESLHETQLTRRSLPTQFESQLETDTETETETETQISPAVASLLSATDLLSNLWETDAPCDKIRSVVEACGKIFLLKKDMGAEDFMPVLCWALILANPPQLAVDLFLMSKFISDEDVGLPAYCLTSLNAAVSHLVREAERLERILEE